MVNFEILNYNNYVKTHFSLTLEEFITLESELNGLINLQTGEKISKGIITSIV